MTTRQRQPVVRPAWRALGLVAAATFALAGCGGGGDSTDEDDGGTGLVPDAPALGATLFSDATLLRPMADGARWNYAGTSPDGAYTNVVTQTEVQVGVNEAGTNILDSGAHTTHVVVAGGSIVQPDPADANGDGLPDYADAIELRSPVRVNDQIVVVDKRQPDAIPDMDGDGRREFFDVAMYSRVIGSEVVELSGIGSLQAVRVDRTTQARIVLSKDGTKLPSFTTVYSVWYAPSVGIVRRRFEKPADNGSGKDVTDERATGWSGLP